ncbi:hypothetical protein [Kitasatospora sp. NPDC004289]
MAIFLLGMAGALAPEIVRLYEIRNDPERFQWSWFYLVASAAFAALGGLLAVAMPATTYWGALYIGVSTPVLINSIVRKGRERTRPQLRSWPPASAAPTQHSAVDSYVYGL